MKARKEERSESDISDMVLYCIVLYCCNDDVDGSCWMDDFMRMLIIPIRLLYVFVVVVSY